MNPKHWNNIPKNHRAFAPYNFVELPDQVIDAESLPEQNTFSSDRHTGRILCKLTTESPLYIRCGLSPSDFKRIGDLSTSIQDLKELTSAERSRRTDFFKHPASLYPVIPGSSLRGMLRTLIEIVSFSKIEKVSDYHRFFFRAVAAPAGDALGEEYDKILGKGGTKVKAGYLERQADGSWHICPAQPIEGKSFIWVKEPLVITSGIELTPMDDRNYYPQQITVSFQDIQEKNGRYFAQQVSSDLDALNYKGMLVTSGNMIEGNRTGEKTKRKNHCLIREKNSQVKPLKIDDGAILDYCRSLTEFQKEKIDQDNGVLENHRPVFYCEPPKDKDVTLFGHNPNFRIPYSPNRDGRAASVANFIPFNLRNPDSIDIAEAIFGWVTSQYQKAPARAGRVFISDATIDAGHPLTDQEIWITGNADGRIIPKILATPKPTTFQHYLVQSENTKAEREKLKHYGSQPNVDTVIRGHKLYWHQKNVSLSYIQESRTSEIDDKPKQYTEIKPIRENITFQFTIRFENLSDVELGALLWILNLAQDKQHRSHITGDQKYRFLLGMGKPFGMGAIKITREALWLSERGSKRYHQLFNDQNQWETGDREDTELEAEYCVDEFKRYILKGLGKDPEEQLEDMERIKMLLVMLSFPGQPRGKTRYMEIERLQPNGSTENEYAKRHVLPLPKEV